jgi:SNF2 family DNA or RNA helicase
MTKNDADPLHFVESTAFTNIYEDANVGIMICSKDQPEEDEALLLAALGSTTALASAYEHSVLRDAQLRSAPQIILPQSTIATAIVNPIHTSSSLVPCGEECPTLPDLSSLAPSTSRKKKGSVGADVPHVLTLLSRTRDLLRSTKQTSGASHGGGVTEEDEQKRRREIDLLSMKEQILLGYLTDVAGLKEDDAVIPQRNVIHERKRQRINNDAGEDYYGNAKCSDTFLETFSDATKRGSKIQGKKEKSDIHTSSTNRLDRIKNGEQLETSHKRPLKRISMMSMKSQMRVESGMSPLKTMDEVQFDEEKSRKRREDRRKRRLKRHRAALGIDSFSDDEHEFEATPGKITGILKNTHDGVNVESNVEEKKSEDNDVPILKTHDEHTKKIGVCWASADEANAQETSPNFKRRNHTKVFCPVCQVILTVDHSEESNSPDEFLAEHIQECQQISRMRNGGRTLRKRKKPAVIDLGDDETGDAESEMEITSLVSLDKSEAADDYLQVDHEETDGGKKSPPVSIDDMDELDYEERIDDWIERGLEQMGDMAERDCDERPPGAIVHEGGLEIPAWVNDRLFPYQRTGVRWMWELHCQGAGGVGKLFGRYLDGCHCPSSPDLHYSFSVGDEMGLGKTVQVSSFLGAMASSRLLDSVLIVVPATVLSHWLRELKVWAPGLRRIMVHRSGETDGVSRQISRGMLRHLEKWLKNARADRVNEPIDEDDYNIYKEHSFCGTGYALVTTYESIRRTPEVWTNHTWSYVVLDEGQKIRNPDADITLACKRLRTHHRLLLSGTPIQNDLRELWSLFDFIFPGRLGTLPAFEAEFAEPIKRGGYSNASPMQVQLAYR